MRWLNEQAVGTLFLTATVVSEAFYGIEKLPEGRRKSTLRSDLQRLVSTYFAGAVLPFDEAAAYLYASLVTSAARQGKAIHVGDGQIAAVALTKRFSVVTRDVMPFEAAGCHVINPFTDR